MRPLGRLGISTSPQDDTQLWVPMALLQGLAAAVLLTSCLNLANMMLAFGSARQKEIAIRLAVGGARSRIVRQLLVQGLMLSIGRRRARPDRRDVGGAAARRRRWRRCCRSRSPSTCVPTRPCCSRRCSSARSPRSAFGLWPALRLSRPDLLSSLKDQAGEVSGKIGGRITVRGALVTAQLALSLALLVLSGLFVRGAAAGASANPGFDLDPLVVAHIEPKLGGYDTAQGREAQRAVLERLRSHRRASSRWRPRRCCRSATTRSAPRCSARGRA